MTIPCQHNFVRLGDDELHFYGRLCQTVLVVVRQLQALSENTNKTHIGVGDEVYFSVLLLLLQHSLFICLEPGNTVRDVTSTINRTV